MSKNHAFAQQEVGADVGLLHETAQAFAQAVEADDGDEEGQSGREDDEGFGAEPTVAFGQHGAPFGDFGEGDDGDACDFVAESQAAATADEDADEGEFAHEHEGGTEFEEADDEELGQEVGQDVAHGDGEVGGTGGLCAFDVGHFCAG